MGKTLRSRKSTAVQGTNDSSSVSKASMAYKGYFHDDFIQYFVKKKTNGHNVVRSPLINRGYYIRNYVLNKIICDFLNYFNMDSNMETQIVSIGSGFDSTFFRLKHQGMIQSGTVYVEVDFPELQKRKLSLIKDEELLHFSIGENKSGKLMDCSDLKFPIIWNGKNYKMIGCDLTETSKLLELLKEVGVRTDVPTLILSEVVLTYLSADHASNVISWTSKTFTNATFLTYEQIYPHDEFGNFMCKHFQKLGSPLKSIFAFPTLEAHIDRYLKQGWHLCSASTMSHFYLQDLPRDERLRINSLEMFDEFEEWMLKCNHYFVLTASQGLCQKLDKKIWRERPLNSKTEANKNRYCSNEAGFVMENLDCKDQKCFQCGNPTNASECRKANCETFIKKSKCCNSNNSPWNALNVHSNVENHPGNPAHDVKEVVLNCSRYGHSSCILKLGGEDHVFVIGGFGDANLDDQCDTKLIKESIEDKLRIKACVDDNRTNFESDHGPNDRSNRKAKHCRLKDVSLFNLSQNITDHISAPLNSQQPNKGLAEKSINSPIFERLHASCTLLSHGRVLIFGGRKSPDYLCSSLILMTIGHDLLVKTSVAHLTKAPSLKFHDIDLTIDGGVEEKEEGDTHFGGVAPVARWRHSATCVEVLHSESEVEELIIIHGGITRGGKALSDTWSLSTSNWAWNYVPSSTNSPGDIHSHSSDWWRDGNSLVISGGMNNDEQPQKHIYLLDLSSFEWRTLECLDNLEKRFSHTSHIIGDKLILVGGVGPTHPSPGISVVNLRSGVLQNFYVPLATEVNAISLAYQFHNHTSYLLTRKNEIGKQHCVEILVLGGGGNYFSFGTKVRYGGLHFKLHL